MAYASNDTLRRRLMIATVLAEAVVIPTCAWTAFKLAGGDLAIALPLLAVSALEVCRIPLSSYATRLKPIAKLTAVTALAAIEILTGEVMTVGFSSLLEGRLASVTGAAAARDAAQGVLTDSRDRIDRLTADAAAPALRSPNYLPARRLSPRFGRRRAPAATAARTTALHPLRCAPTQALRRVTTIA